MNASDIMPASGLSRIVDALLRGAAIGLRSFVRGGERANMPASLSLSLLNRLALIVRCAFVILAVHLDLAPLRRSARRCMGARACRPRRASFRLFAPSFRLIDAEAPRQPNPFAGVERDPVLTAQRKIDALARALANPLPLIRRMARRLPTQLMVFGWRPPKRPPPLPRRDFFDYLLEGFREARFVLSDWRRRRGDSGEDAPASPGCGECEPCPSLRVGSVG